MEVEVTSDIENKLLGRREVRCLFRGVFGHLSRSDAVQAVSKKLKASEKAVYVISIDGESGTRDAKGLFYIYGSEEDAKKDLPEYILKRNASTVATPEEAKAQPEKSEEKKAKPEKPEEAKAEPEETKTQPEKPEEGSKEPSEAPKE